MRGDGGAPRGFRAQQKPLRIKLTRYRIWKRDQDRRTSQSTKSGQRTGPRNNPPKAARADQNKGTAKPDTPRTPGSSRGRSVTPANKRPAKAEPKRPRSERARRKKQPAGPRSTPRRRRDTGKDTKGAAGSHGADNGANKQRRQAQFKGCAARIRQQSRSKGAGSRSIWKTPGARHRTDENCERKVDSKTHKNPDRDSDRVQRVPERRETDERNRRTKTSNAKNTNIGERGNSQLARERVC